MARYLDFRAEVTFLGAVTAALFSLCAWSAEVTPEQARAAAVKWLARNPVGMTAAFRSSDVEEPQTAVKADGRALFHVLEVSGDGYVVMSADTRLPPVVAFSASGTLDPGDAGNPLVAFLERSLTACGEAIEAGGAATAKAARGAPAAGSCEAKWAALLDGGRFADKTSRQTISDVRVEPLVKSKWDQGEWN